MNERPLLIVSTKGSVSEDGIAKVEDIIFYAITSQYNSPERGYGYRFIRSGDDNSELWDIRKPSDDPRLAESYLEIKIQSTRAKEIDISGIREMLLAGFRAQQILVK